MSRPALSRQLRLLVDARLVTWVRSYADGRVRLYTTNPRRLGVITAWFAGTEIGYSGLGMRLRDDGQWRVPPD